jgi:chitin disaccharide deacetylase
MNKTAIIFKYIEMKKTTLLITCLLTFAGVSGQNGKNLAELLGYPRDSKLLIIHADDMGLSKSVNNACIKAFGDKAITSGSIMMPCPQSASIINYIKAHPGTDAGIHITMTAEWDNYKWGGILPASEIPSLVDGNGNFYPTVEDLGKSAKGTEAEKEIRAQIDKAIAAGIKPTHLDTHMGSVMANPELIKVYITLAAEYRLPFLLPREYLSWFPEDVAKELGKNIFLLDNLFMLEPQMVQDEWIGAYKKAIAGMVPGLNQMIVHLGYDDSEMQEICKGHFDYGSEWRNRDLDLVTGKEFKELLKSNKIILVSWGQIRDLMNQPAIK